MASKVKCSRDIPCSRCVRLKIQCCPNPRLPGRPLKRQLGPGAEGEAPKRPAGAGPGARGGGSLGHLDAIGMSGFQAPTGLRPSFVLAFVSALTGHRVHLGRARSMLRAWQRWNEQAERECTRGNLPALSFILGIEAHAVEEPPDDQSRALTETESLASEALGPPRPPPPPRRSSTPANGLHSLAVAALRAQELENAELHAAKGPPVVKACPFPPPPPAALPTPPQEMQFLRSLVKAEPSSRPDAPAPAACGVFWAGGDVEVMVNERFALGFLSRERLWAAVVDEGCRPEFLLDQLMDPESRAVYYDGLVEACFGRPEALSMTVRSLRLIERSGRFLSASVTFGVFTSTDGRCSGFALHVMPVLHSEDSLRAASFMMQPSDGPAVGLGPPPPFVAKKGAWE